MTPDTGDLMRALVVESPEGRPRLVRCAAPTPAEGELTIGVRACGLNFADLLLIQGRYQEQPDFPLIPGLEVAGVVEAVGAGVDTFTSGQRVMALPRSGGLAEAVAVPAARVRPCPDGLDDVTAAGFQIVYGTAHLALTRRARLSPGETLVVLGASGGAGLAAIEIGRALGARVVAVARGAEKQAIARAAGAETAIDSDDGDLLRQLRAAGPADVVYDAVGGDAGEAALRTLRPEGRYLPIGFASGRVPDLKANHLMVKNIDVVGVNWGGYLAFDPGALGDSLERLTGLCIDGRLRPRIAEILPLERAAEGLERIRSRAATGKIVVTT